MTTMNVLDASGATVAIEKPLTPGRAAAAASRPVALSSEDNAALLALSHADTRPVSANITAADVGTSSASGQNSVSIITGAPTANSSVSQAINGQSTARVQISGTWIGALAFEGAADGGTIFIAQPARITGTSFTAGSVTGNGLFTIDVSGLTNLRVRATAWTSGAAVVQMAFAQAAGFVQVSNPLRLVDNASGAQATIKPASTAPATTDTAIVTGIADGNHVTIGAKTDAANSATNGTAVSAMSVWKQISASIQAAAASLAGIASTARLPSAAASTNATNVKTSAGRVYSASGKNNAAYDIFLVLYDATTNPPVPGTTTIRKKVVCPAGQAFVYDWPLGLSFAAGIGYAFTKLVADADTTVLVAADIIAFNLDYV